VSILVTGAAGFIGYHTCLRLLGRGDDVVGIDNLNDYYDPRLKEGRLEQLRPIRGFRFERIDITDKDAMVGLFARVRPRRVVHLAAQAGVRYSLENPHAYVDANLVGFMNILECCRHGDVEHLVYASSSSVYGLNTMMPFSVADNVDHPVSMYAATKKANELMAHTYSHLFGLPTTGLRFFTVYGPWGRPDMALFMFTKAILNNEPIGLFNYGKMRRDFTYVDDIVEGVTRVLDKTPKAGAGALEPGSSPGPYRVYNIGNGSPVELLRFVEVIEGCLGKKAVTNMLPMQPGDVEATWADVDALKRDVGFGPNTPIEVGVPKFVAWYRAYHGT
jgi:UDP-glucuronate 4-epimerase